MSRRVEAPTEVAILFWAQAPVTSPVCKECKGGKIHDIRENKAIVYCKGEACATPRESIKSMWKARKKGGSTS